MTNEAQKARLRTEAGFVEYGPSGICVGNAAKPAWRIGLVRLDTTEECRPVGSTTSCMKVLTVRAYRTTWSSVLFHPFTAGHCTQSPTRLPVSFMDMSPCGMFIFIVPA